MQLLQSVLPFLKQYVWYKDGFELNSSVAVRPPWTQARRRVVRNQPPLQQQGEGWQ